MFERAQRRRLAREAEKKQKAFERESERIRKMATPISELHDNLQRFNEEDLLGACAAMSATRNPERWPPHALAGIVRETALLRPNGEEVVSPEDMELLRDQFLNLFDPWLLDRLGLDLSEVVVGRLMADQALHQRDPATDLLRTSQVLGQADIDWRGLVGLSIPEWLLLSMWTIGVFEQTPCIHRAELIDAATNGIPTLGERLPALLASLSATAGELSDVAHALRTGLDAESAIRSPSPVRDRPIVELGNGLLILPVREYLELALAPIGLYIKAIRAGAATQVGEAFHRYLLQYANETLASCGWRVLDVDELDLKDGRRADILLVPPDGSFLVVVEAKSATQVLEAQLGSLEGRARSIKHYQSWFEQIDGTLDNLDVIRVAIPQLAEGAAVYGLAVTLERHLVGVRAGATTASLSLGDSSDEMVASPTQRAPARVVSAEDLEAFFDAGCTIGTAACTRVLDELFRSSATARQISRSLADLGVVRTRNPFVRRVWAEMIVPAHDTLTPDDYSALLRRVDELGI